MERSLKERLIEQINIHLDLCNPSETPYVCAMLDDEKNREILIQEIVKKVIQNKLDIPDAIVEINNENDPNYLD